MKPDIKRVDPITPVIHYKGLRFIPTDPELQPITRSRVNCPGP
jgi:hypothetical protein